MADQNKTEQATPKRREKAREQGQIARSRELPSILAIVGAVAALSFMCHDAVTHWTTFYRNVLTEAAAGDFQSSGPIFFWSGIEVFRWMVPVLLTSMLLSMGAGFAQGGFSIAPEALMPKFERFNPASKIGQIFSIAGLNNMMKSLLPFGAIVWIATDCIRSNWGVMVRASSFGVKMMASTMGDMIYSVGWKSALVMIAWSGIDYLLTWKKMEGDLKMSREEIKEEHKQSDGNPVSKGRIRRMQRRMRKKQVLAAAATATVIVTNPTHYAVALRYTPEMTAPIVVAKGMNLLAQQIKAIGTENGILLLENKPLAQALYKTVEVGEAIPSALYQAVADILVIVFRAQAEVRLQEQKRRSRNASGELVRG